MLKYEYIRYLNFPKLPDEIIGRINFEYSEYEKKVDYQEDMNYVWTDFFNQDVNAWCKENVCSSMHWGFQIISGELPIHRDNGTLIKINYILSAGGNNVVTNFYDDNHNVVDSILIPEHSWHVFKADSLHGVQGVEPGKIRFAITGRVF